MQKALITGATSGIGYELAKLMASKGHDLVLASRNQQKLDEIKQAFAAQYGISIKVVRADLSQPGSAESLYAKLKGDGIEIVVNNAGSGLMGNFFDNDLSKNQSMAHLNMISLMELSYLFGKDLVKLKRGRILSIASIVSFFPGPKQPVYYATKAFVRSLSRALAYNLRGSGVTVTALHPGVTKTSFFNAADASFFSGGASPRAVAELGYRAMMKGKIEVTHGLWNKFLTNVFVRITPYRAQPLVVDKFSEV